MKIRFGLALSAALFLSSSNFALAAATAEEAARITKVFEAYLGSEKGVISVEPKGDDYALTLDFAPLAKKSAESGATMSMSPFKMILTPKGEGKWNVTHEGALEFSLKVPNSVSMDAKADAYTWQGIFDEKLGTFEHSTSEVKNMTVVEMIDDPKQGKTDATITVNSLKYMQDAKDSGHGGADLNMKYEFEGLTETIAAAANSDRNTPPMNLVITAANGDYTGAGKDFKSKSIFQLLAFFVAHPDKDMIIKDQVNLKQMLTAAIPMFENMNMIGTMNTVSVASPIGPITADKVSIGVDMNGIVKDGKVGESFSITGLVIPPAVIPPWAVKLVPKNLAFDFSVSDFDLATPAQMMLAALDLAKDPPLPEGFEATLMPTLMPKGAVTIALNPTSISNETYELKVQGSMTAGPAALPSGKADIAAKGLDEVMKIVQAAPPEAGLQQGMAAIIAAKGMAKADADGTLNWHIESTGDGKVLVNGIDPMKMQ
jgi:hypothetical protein